MLKALFQTLARVSPVVDTVLEIKKTLELEVRIVLLCSGGLGIGLGFLITGIVASLLTAHWLAYLSLGLGALLSVGFGWRLYIAKKRVKALKELLTAAKLRESVSTYGAHALDKAKSLVKRLVSRG